MTRPLTRRTTVDEVAAALRRRILDGELPPGTPLREQHLSAEYGVARHTVRAALRALATESAVRIETHRGARVTTLTREDIKAHGALRIALEVEAARLALARHDGHLPAEVHAAARALADACRNAAGFTAVTEAHEALHHTIVAASASPRIVAAHRALGGEVRLYLSQLRPTYDLDRLATEHLALLEALKRDGPDVLRSHIQASTQALLDALH
jgi:DNA-binding GntR family transcriptional regulator